MKEVRVFIPEESWSVINFVQEDMPGVGLINTALRSFEGREVFAWHLSLMLELEDLVENGMPSYPEREVIESLEKGLNAELTLPKEKPNALFVGRITWNSTRELIWRVFDPEVANEVLQRVINEKSYTREFDFKMEHDPVWKRAEWHLKKR